MTLGDLLSACRDDRKSKVDTDTASAAAVAAAQAESQAADAKSAGADATLAAELKKLQAVAVDTTVTPPLEYDTPDGQTITTRPTADLSTVVV